MTDAWTDGVIIISDGRQREEGKNNKKSRTGTIYQLMQMNQFTQQKKGSQTQKTKLQLSATTTTKNLGQTDKLRVWN